MKVFIVRTHGKEGKNHWQVQLDKKEKWSKTARKGVFQGRCEEYGMYWHMQALHNYLIEQNELILKIITISKGKKKHILMVLWY